jgi:hypothetical protein
MIKIHDLGALQFRSHFIGLKMPRVVLLSGSCRGQSGSLLILTIVRIQFSAASRLQSPLHCSLHTEVCSQVLEATWGPRSWLPSYILKISSSESPSLSYLISPAFLPSLIDAWQRKKKFSLLKGWFDSTEITLKVLGNLPFSKSVIHVNSFHYVKSHIPGTWASPRAKFCLLQA